MSSPVAGERYRQQLDTFTSLIRQPGDIPGLDELLHTPDARHQLYRYLVRQNMQAMLAGMLPFSWNELGRIDAPLRQTLFNHFMEDWPCHDPLPAAIPAQFLQFLQQSPVIQALWQPTVPWLAEMAHYEYLLKQISQCGSGDVWAEVPSDIPLQHDTPLNTRFNTRFPLHLMLYRWPVHQWYGQRIIQQMTHDTSPGQWLLLLWADGPTGVQIRQCPPVWGMVYQHMTAQQPVSLDRLQHTVQQFITGCDETTARQHVMQALHWLQQQIPGVLSAGLVLAENR